MGHTHLSHPATPPHSAPRPPRASAFIPIPTISVPSRAASGTPGLVMLQDGFRPFYLAGALFAAVAVPLWLGMWYHGYATPAIPPLLWHMHEMVFGFAAAIIVGFLFTAARNWTGLPLPAGTHLALLVGLWAAGRLGMMFAYGPVTAVTDSSLLLIVAGVLARKFIRARSLCSMPLVLVLVTLATTNIAFHASMLGRLAVSPIAAVELGLLLVVLVEMIIAGRVVPGFTINAIPGVRIRRSPWLHRASLGLAAAAIVTDFLLPFSPWAAALAMAAGLAVAAQAIGWNPLATRSRPMLWILHVSYAWIPVGFVLLGLSSLGIVPRSAAIHAFAAGSMAGLIIGMITRTALGHSGRSVRAGPVEVVMYVLVQAAAVLRVAGALVPALYLLGMAGAGAAWTAAFGLYIIAYAPLLLNLRPAPTGPLPMPIRAPCCSGHCSPGHAAPRPVPPGA